MSTTMRTYCRACGWYVEAPVCKTVRRSMWRARWQSLRFDLHYVRHVWATRNG